MARVARAVVGPGPEVDDVVQDAFLRVFLHRREIGGLRDEGAWVTVLARRVALDHRKRNRRIGMHEISVEVEVEVPGPARAADEIAGYRRELALISGALPTLASRDRRLLELVLGGDPSEAGIVAGRPAASERRHLGEIREKLRWLLALSTSRRKR
jgi:DNA-directed RNA polymerase specialized sigma24 family protein